MPDGQATGERERAAARALAHARPVPFWLDRPDAPPAEPALAGPARAGLAVIGGGFTGLWTALLAKERDPDADVALLEGRSAPWTAWASASTPDPAAPDPARAGPAGQPPQVTWAGSVVSRSWPRTSDRARPQHGSCMSSPDGLRCVTPSSLRCALRPRPKGCSPPGPSAPMVIVSVRAAMGGSSRLLRSALRLCGIRGPMTG